MAIVTQKISNHPLFSNINRTIDVIGFDVNDISKILNIRCVVNYTDGAEDVSNHFPQNVFTITASNQDTVVLRDGAGNPVLDAEGNEQHMPQYDYVVMLMNQPTQITQVFAFFIQLNDGLKTFDN